MYCHVKRSAYPSCLSALQTRQETFAKFCSDPSKPSLFRRGAWFNSRLRSLKSPRASSVVLAHEISSIDVAGSSWTGLAPPVRPNLTSRRIGAGTATALAPGTVCLPPLDSASPSVGGYPCTKWDIVVPRSANCWTISPMATSMAFTHTLSSSLSVLDDKSSPVANWNMTVSSRSYPLPRPRTTYRREPTACS